MDIHLDGDRILTWTVTGGVPCRARCAIGRGGIGDKAAEGDGLTPVGRYSLRGIMIRADRLAVQSALPVSHIGKNDGWCDDPASPDYNTRIILPHPASHEKLWRDDALYDVMVEIGFNDDPVVPGRGSAVFIHLARPGYLPTQGCIALARDDLLNLLAVCDGGTRLVIVR